MILEDVYAENNADRILNNHDVIDPDVTDPDEYEDFAPMTLRTCTLRTMPIGSQKIIKDT